MKLRKHLRRTASLVLAAAVLGAFSGCEDDVPHPENQIIEYKLTAEPLSLDPQIAEDSASVILIKNLFEGLVRENAGGELVSGAAKSWDISDSGTVYTFHLQDTKWSDGTPVKADDFVFGITRALDPVTRSKNAPDLFLIDNAQQYAAGKAAANDVGIKAIDDKTLEITLEYPSDNLLNVLTLPAAMPCSREFFETSKGKYGKDPELVITNGPFRIRENYGWDHNKYIYIRRSENYECDNKALPLGVNFTIGDAPADPIAAIDSGECDICEIYGNQLARAQEKEFPVETTSNTLWGICYNTDIKAFKNAKLRVSLLGSLDREELLSDVPESYVKTSQLIADNISFGGKVYRKEVGDFKLDRAQSPEQMYSKALGELADNEIELKKTYTIICLDDDASSKIVTKLIAGWNEITGSYFNKEALPRTELLARISSGDYEIAVAPLNTAVDSPMEFLSSFKSDSMSNAINLNYPAYDGFIDSALSADSVDKTITSLASAEEYLIEYGYLYPLYYESRYFASAQNVSGTIFDSTSDAIDFTCTAKIVEE